MNKKLLGILLMTLGMFCLSVNDMTYKNLTMNFPVWEAIFFRAFSGSIISLFLVYRSGIVSLKTKKPIRHFVRAFSAVGCVVLYIFGIKYLKSCNSEGTVPQITPRRKFWSINHPKRRKIHKFLTTFSSEKFDFWGFGIQYTRIFW